MEGDVPQWPSIRLTAVEVGEIMEALQLVASQMPADDPARLGLWQIAQILGRAMDREDGR